MTAVPPSGDAETEIPVSDLSYTEASRELDAIVDFFEQREVDVDLLVARLERATAIVDELDRRISQTRMRVEELVPRLEAATRAATLPSPETGSAEPEDEELEGCDDEEPADGDSDSERPLF